MCPGPSRCVGCLRARVCGEAQLCSQACPGSGDSEATNGGAFLRLDLKRLRLDLKQSLTLGGRCSGGPCCVLAAAGGDSGKYFRALRAVSCQTHRSN